MDTRLSLSPPTKSLGTRLVLYMTESVNTAQHFMGKYSKSAEAAIHSEMAQLHPYVTIADLAWCPGPSKKYAMHSVRSKVHTSYIDRETWGKCQHYLKCSILRFKMYMYLAPKEMICSGRITKFHQQCPVDLATAKTGCFNGMSPGHCNVLPVTISTFISQCVRVQCSYKNKQIILS